MKKIPLQIAIIGSGFAGLALAHALACDHHASCMITVFHKDDIGKGASGVAAGLLHPFPSGKTKRSHSALEALHASISLLQQAQLFSQKPVFRKEEILKIAHDDEQKKEFAAISRKYENLAFKTPEQLSHLIASSSSLYGLEIEQGYLVDGKNYLFALKACLQSLGVQFVQKTVTSPKELEGFDHIAYACGDGVQSFFPKLKTQAVKGQILTCYVKEPLTKKALIGHGYICPTNDPHIYAIGSTYEHRFKDGNVDVKLAKSKILPPWYHIFPQLKGAEVLDCQAGIRVMHPPTYLPFIKKIGERSVVLAGLGSRGLLYHSYLARSLARYLLEHIEPSKPFFK